MNADRYSRGVFRIPDAVEKFLELKPTLHMLNKEWGLMQHRRGGLKKPYFIHYCFSGDTRVVRGKECELCRVSVPEAVQFLAQVLLPQL